MNLNFLMVIWRISAQSEIANSTLSSLNKTSNLDIPHAYTIPFSNTINHKVPGNLASDPFYTNLNGPFIPNQTIENIAFDPGFKISQYDASMLERFKDPQIISVLSSSPPKKLGEFLDMIFNDFSNSTLNKFEDLVRRKVNQVRTSIYNYTIDFLSKSKTDVSTTPQLTDAFKKDLKDYIDAYPFEKMKYFSLRGYLEIFIRNIKQSIFLTTNWLSNGYLEHFFNKARNISLIKRALTDIIQNTVKLTDKELVSGDTDFLQPDSKEFEELLKSILVKYLEMYTLLSSSSSEERVTNYFTEKYFKIIREKILPKVEFNRNLFVDIYKKDIFNVGFKFIINQLLAAEENDRRK